MILSTFVNHIATRHLHAAMGMIINVIYGRLFCFYDLVAIRIYDYLDHPSPCNKLLPRMDENRELWLTCMYGNHLSPLACAHRNVLYQWCLLCLLLSIYISSFATMLPPDCEQGFGPWVITCWPHSQRGTVAPRFKQTALRNQIFLMILQNADCWQMLLFDQCD